MLMQVGVGEIKKHIEKWNVVTKVYSNLLIVIFFEKNLTLKRNEKHIHC